MRSAVLLLHDPALRQVTAASITRLDRWRARWHSTVLDEELAAGAPADTDRLRAVRAGMLLTQAHRRLLAASWTRVLRHASGAARQAPAAPPLPRARVRDADEEIRALIGDLTEAAPLAVRGLAAATLLLGDGTGPLYNPHSGRDLAATVRAARRYLDPSLELVPLGL